MHMLKLWRIAAVAVVLPVAACGPGVRAADPAPTPHPTIDLGYGVAMRPEQLNLTNRGGNRCELSYPVVVRAPTPALRRSLQDALGMKSVLGTSPGEYRREVVTDDYGCIDASFSIHAQRGSLVDLEYWLEVHGGGASRYGFRHRVVDLRTGRRLTAEQAFHPALLDSLARVVDRRMQADLQDSVRVSRYHRLDEEEVPPHFRAEHLDNLSVDEKGIIFSYEFEFPEIAPLQPAAYFFSWAELRPYVRPDGPLAPLLP
ncbi:MAG TPA: hypothetical protein VF615_20985 [Longimicrobiaceae bacterium]|jgi:hypothetical protein